MKARSTYIHKLLHARVYLKRNILTMEINDIRVKSQTNSTNVDQTHFHYKKRLQYTLCPPFEDAEGMSMRLVKDVPEKA